jgi:hypothetical protein
VSGSDFDDARLASLMDAIAEGLLSSAADLIDERVRCAMCAPVPH